MTVYDSQAETIRNNFNSTATFTPATGQAVFVQCEYIENEVFQPGGYESQVWATEKTIECLLADLPHEPNDDETFTIGSNIYKVKRVIEKDNWFVKCSVK